MPYPAKKIERYNWVLKQPLHRTCKLVLMALVTHDTPDATGIYPSREVLARDASMTIEGVRKALYRLRADGWITWIRCYKNGIRLNDVYQIRSAFDVENVELQSEFE